MEKDKLMTEIMAQDFLTFDLQLFMDTHPNDKTALAEYKSAVEKSAKLHGEYAANYGPLSIRDTISADSYTWMTPEWPWQNNYIK